MFIILYSGKIEFIHTCKFHLQILGMLNNKDINLKIVYKFNQF